MTVYTKQGDNGESRVFSGDKKSKSDPVFGVLGTLDELNASLSLVRFSRDKQINEQVLDVQKDIMVMGAAIAGVDFVEEDNEAWNEKVRELERSIDFFDRDNKPLNKLIVPGGSSIAVYLNISRAICRRTERILVYYLERRDDLAEKFKVFQIYLNRLSDLLFVMGRYANKLADVDDVVWDKV